MSKQNLLNAIIPARIDQALLLELLNKCGTPLFVKNRSHQFQLVNDALCELVGLTHEDMIGKTDFDLYSRAEAEEFCAGDELVFESKTEVAYEEVLTDASNNSRNIRTIKNVYRTSDGEELLVGTLHDITELRKTQSKLEDAVNHLSVVATTDSLTGLSDRSQLESSIEYQIKIAEETGGKFCIIFIDLNGFKVINDTAGHLVGDEILRVCARRLQNIFRSGTALARVGGDEFLALLPKVDRAGATTAIDRIFKSFTDPIAIKETSWQVGCSVGVAIYPGHGETVSELIRNADFAMYEAKKGNQNCDDSNNSSAEFFKVRIGRSMARKRRIECALNFRENCSKIRQSYQPIVSRRNRDSYEIVGFESLARWDLDGKSVSPEEFIPILEKGGAIIPFGYQVIESACEFISEKCNEDQFVSVNLSYRQIVEPGFSDRVENTIRNARINPQQIALELTEQDANLDSKTAFLVLSRLSKIGITTFLDDFGSGYSNLSRLSELPIDVVKLDKSLLWGDSLLFNSVLQMIQNLGFRSIIEGVETPAHIKSIEVLGADMMQGYFFGKPETKDHDWSNFDPNGTIETHSLPLPSTPAEFQSDRMVAGLLDLPSGIANLG